MRPHWLVALYPAAWRDRYGDEFLALLEERPPRSVDILDIARGAIDAHLFPQAPEGRSWMFMRFTGLAALFAGVALLVGLFPLRLDLVEGMGPVVVATYAVPAFYVLAFLGATGIHLRQTRVRPNLAWPGFVAVLFGLVMGSSSVSLSMHGGGIPNSDFGVLQAIGLWVGSAAMGAAILAIGVVPRVIGLAFVIGAALALIGPLAGDALTRSETLTGLSQSGIVVYALGWIVAGVSLQVAQPEPGIPGPLAT